MPQAEVVRSATTPHGIWTFIALDCTSFGLFFMVFMVERLGQPALFDRSARLLDFRLGLLNTLILITSSWLVALANRAGRLGDMRAARRWLTAAVIIASGFGIVKGFEYADKIRAGHTVTSDTFFSYYFALTGVHLLHYLIGMIMLGFLALRVGFGEGARDLAWLDGGALYWHMVDLLWVFLFAMLYLVGAR
jgi:nitric oxide reductase NorE protein